MLDDDFEEAAVLVEEPRTVRAVSRRATLDRARGSPICLSDTNAADQVRLQRFDQLTKQTSPLRQRMIGNDAIGNTSPGGSDKATSAIVGLLGHWKSGTDDPQRPGSDQFDPLTGS
jgi:hypothetical protein